MKETKFFCDICGEEILPDDFKKEGGVNIVSSHRIIIDSTDSDSPVKETIFIDGIGSPDYKVDTCYRCLLGAAIFMTNEKKTVFAKYINDSINSALMRYSEKKRLKRINKMGYVFEEKGKLYLVCCPECSKENYGPAVASGQCCWCGRIATKEDMRDDKT